jgi:hypothetical protein
MIHADLIGEALVLVLVLVILELNLTLHNLSMEKESTLDTKVESKTSSGIGKLLNSTLNEIN